MILLTLFLSLAVYAGTTDETPKNPNEVAKELLTDGTGETRCEGLLSESPLSKHNITFITSGRETVESHKEHADAIEELFGPKGVLTRLGLTTDRPTIIHFMRGADMAAATANGRFPVTHYAEGAQLMAGRGGGLIYEIAIPGKNVQHSIYRDDNPFIDQYSIMIHVAGHNHFTFHTKFSQQREYDLNREAIELDKMIRKAYLEVDREEVTLWYQFIDSLGHAQDILDGLHKKPEDFAVDLNRAPRRPLLLTEPVDDMRHPKQPTRSVLQAFIGNLPADTPTWKREIALQYEKLIRWQTSILNTKIVNEGFATFLMELVPKHTSKNTFEDANSFANLAYGVTYPRLNNPYYLGIEAWRRIYRRFMERPEMQVAGLTSFDKDKAFIKYATEEIIAKMNDIQFLTFALDEEWVRGKKLRLTRELDWSVDQDNNPNDPRPSHLQFPGKFLVLSDDYKTVVEALINQVARRERSIPQVILTDFNFNRTNTIRLELNDKWSATRPLTNSSIAKTLFVYAQIMNQPVSIESTHIIETVVMPEKDEDDDDFGMPMGRFGWWPPRPPQPQIIRTPTRVKLTVTPNGEIKAHKILWNGSSDLKDIPQNPFLENIKNYKYEEVEMPEIVPPIKRWLDKFIIQLKMTARANTINDIPLKFKLSAEGMNLTTADSPTAALFDDVPTAASALSEYDSYVQARAEDMFKFALNNNTLIRGAGGVSFRILPEQPFFRYNDKLIKEMDQERDPRRPDRNASIMRVDHFSVKDPEGTVRPSDGKPGDSYWDENPPQHPGVGEGDGEEDEGSCEGDEPGSKPGKGGKDPRYYQVPMDKYAKALEELIELPNLRPKMGITKTQAVEYTSLRATERGVLAEDESYEQAYQMGIARFLKERKTLDEIKAMPKKAIIMHGLAVMEDPDFRARDSYTIPDPDVNALVTVVLDLSGSMDVAVPVARQMIYDMRAILMRKYKGIKFKFVSFDGKGHVYDTLEEFLSNDLGGGTSYVEGFKPVLNKIYPQFPAGQWDRFFVLMGDFGDFPRQPGEFTKLLDAIANESQYSSAVLFNLYNAGAENELYQYFNSKSKSDDYVGFLEINPPDSYKPIMFRKLFKNKEK